MHNREAKNLELAVEETGEPGLIHGRFRDFEELSAAVAKWDFDFVQLDSGSAPTALAQATAPGLLIQQFRLGLTCLQRGASPSDMRTFGLREPEAQGVRMFGSDVTGADLALFRAGGEFEAVSQPGFGCLSVSIDEARFEEAFESVDVSRGGSRSATGPGLLSVDANTLERLRRRVKQLFGVLEASPGALGRSDLFEELAFELAIDLALAIQSADDTPRRAASRVRDLAFRRAVSYIEDHLDEPITVRGLCEEVGVGWTTLAQVFREHFGMAPKAYIRAVLLNRARRDLLKAAPETLVADVANRWGFWHMGQFAADYRRLFGERPSDTRSRMLAPR